MIAQYQVDKLRYKLTQMVGGRYRSFTNEKTSAHILEHDSKWYKVSIKVEVSLDSNNARKS
jgi:hypothetical protein